MKTLRSLLKTGLVEYVRYGGNIAIYIKSKGLDYNQFMCPRQLQYW